MGSVTSWFVRLYWFIGNSVYGAAVAFVRSLFLAWRGVKPLFARRPRVKAPPVWYRVAYCLSPGVTRGLSGVHTIARRPEQLHEDLVWQRSIGSSVFLQHTLDLGRTWEDVGDNGEVKS